MSIDVRLRAVLSDTLQQDFSSGSDVRRSEVASWDSLNHLRVVISVEEEFGVRFESDEVTSIESMSQLRSLLITKLEGASASADL